MRPSTTVVRKALIGSFILSVLFNGASVSRAAPANESIAEELVESGSGPGVKIFDRIVHLGTEATIQVDIIHDFNAIGLEPNAPVAREFVTSEIPVGGRAAERTNRTVVSPNQSNLILWADTDTEYGQAKIFVDFNMTKDLFGTDFDVYKAWAKFGYLRFGLDYTQFMNQVAIPETLDFEGPQLLPEARFAQAGFRIPIGHIVQVEKEHFFIHIGVETSKGQFTLDPLLDATSEDQVPSVVAKLTYNTPKRNLELAGVYRRLRATGNNSYDSSVNGWGLYLSGYLRTWKKDSLMMGIIGGRGIGALIDDTSGLGLDAAAISATDDQLRPVGMVGAWVGYQHFWNEHFRSTATAGYLKAYTQFIDRNYGATVGGPNGPNTEFVGIYDETVYSSANLIWSPLPLFDAGIEYLYGRQKMAPGSSSYEQNATGHDHRIQVTLRLNFEYGR